MQTIGIVACSAEGAALCYRTICLEGAALLGAHRHPELLMHTPPLSDYVDRLEAGDLAGVGEIMLASAHKLAAAGADFLICPDNTIHQALPLISDRLPRPWVHIATEVGREARRRGLRRVGLSGTRWLVESSVYPAALAREGVDLILPTEAERVACDRIIMEELTLGRTTEVSCRFFQDLFARQKSAGAEAVILGCTEIPLLMNDGNSPLPTLDSTRILARAALDRACA